MAHVYKSTVFDGLSDARLAIQTSPAASLQERLAAASRAFCILLPTDFAEGEDRARFLHIKDSESAKISP